MKFLIVVALAALAAAEPESDAGVYLANPFYSHAYYHASPGLQAHANGAVTPVEPLANQVAKAQHFTAKANAYARNAYVYGYPGLYHGIYKREAESESDPAYVVPSTYGLYPYAHTAGVYGYPTVASTYAYTHPVTTTYGLYNSAFYHPYAGRVIAKREAESDPAYLTYSGFGYPYASTYAGYTHPYTAYGYGAGVYSPYSTYGYGLRYF